MRRQPEEWQRDATRQLAAGRADQAFAAYEERGHVHTAEAREAARGELVERWDAARRASPGESRLILAHTNADVAALNETARGRLREAGAHGPEVTVATERGPRQFATGDRVMFLRNERGLSVENSTLGIVEQVSPERMTVRLDGDGAPRST